MLVEVKLQLFIGYVDTQLLKRVSTEILEPKDVQNSDVSYILFPTERKVKKYVHGGGRGHRHSSRCYINVLSVLKLQKYNIFISAADITAGYKEPSTSLAAAHANELLTFLNLN